MAYFDRDEFILFWLTAALGDGLPAGTPMPLMEPEQEPAVDVATQDAAYGYIIRDWFGPFLLAPSSRCQRGRC